MLCCQEKKRPQRLKITFSRPFLTALLAAVTLPDLHWLLLLGLAAAVHESGHLLALLAFGSRARELRFRLSGMEIRYSQDRLTYGKEAAVALAGPGINLLFAAALAPLALRAGSTLLFLWIGCHAALAAFNLIPALPLDGGRALNSFLCVFWPQAGPQIIEAFGKAAGIVLLALGLYVLLRFRNPTLFTAGVLIFAGGAGKKLYKS